MPYVTRIMIVVLMAMTLLLANIAPALAAEVAQGNCLAFDPVGKTITLQNEVDKAEKTFDLSLAKVGLIPETGNVIRIAYKVESGKNVALKIMNVTKQNLRKE